MPFLLVRQKFTDYARWRAAFDSLADERTRAGLRTVLLTRNADDPAEVVVVFEAEDEVRAREHIAGDALHRAWEAGGVIPETNQVTRLVVAQPAE